VVQVEPVVVKDVVLVAEHLVAADLVVEEDKS
jgi:hypothetical protein